MPALRILAILLLLAPATLLALSSGDQAPRPDRAQSASIRDTRADNRSPGLRRAAERTSPRHAGIGDRRLPNTGAATLTYRVRYEQRTHVADLDPIRTGFAGELERVVLSPSGATNRLVSYRLRADSFTLGDAAAAGVLAPQFALQTVIEMDPAGKPVRYHFDRDMHAVVRMQLKAMFELGQVILPQTESPSWRTTEVDMTGRYEAHYTASAHDVPPGTRDVQKTVDRYTALTSTRGAAPRADELGVTRRSTIRLDAASRSLLTLDANSTVTAAGASGLGRMRVHATLSMSLVKTGPATERAPLSPEARRALLATLDALRPEASPVTPQDREQEMLLALADGKTVAGLIARLTDLMKRDRGESREAYEAMEALAALVALDDANAVLARDAILAGGLPGDVANFVAGALGSAGTPAAQQMLSELASNAGVPPGVRIASLMSLQIPANPTPTAVQTVRALAGRDDEAGLGRTALLAYGTMASRIATIDPTRARALSDDLLARERTLVARGQTDIFLDAIGNAGSGDMYPAVARYLASGDPTLRAHAVGALQNMNDQRAETALRNALTDPHADVRQTAIETAASRPPTQPIADRVIESMLSSPNLSDRKAAVSYLAGATHLPGVRRALTRAARSDRSPALRTLAQQAINRR